MKSHREEETKNNNPNLKEMTVNNEMPFIVKGAGLFFLGTALSSVLKYIFEFVVARRLGPSSFGVFFLGVTVFKLLEKAGLLEVTHGLLRFIPLRKGEGKPERVAAVIFSGLKIGLWAGAILSLSTIIFSSLIGRHIFHAPAGGLVLRILSLGLTFSLLAELIAFSLQALGMIKYRVLLRMILEPALSIILAFIFMRFHPGLGAASTALIVPYFLSAIWGYWLLRKISCPRLPKSIFRQGQFKELLAFSLPLFLATMLSFLVYQLTPLMVGFFRSSREVGLYAAALRTSFLLPLILDAFNAVFAPMIADLTNRQEIKKLEELFKVITKWVFSFTFPLFLIFVLFGRELLMLWGKGYEKAYVCLLFLAAGQVVNCGTGPVGNMISMSGRSKLSLANASATLLLHVILNLVLIPRYGFVGAGLSFSLALALVNLARLAEVWFLLRLHPYQRDFYKPFLYGLVSSLVIYGLKNYLFVSGPAWLRLLIGASILVIIYAFCFLVTGLGEEEKLILRKIKEKLNLL